MDMKNWNKCVGVVTGASSGIGKAIAVKLAENGLIVGAIGRRFERIQEIAYNFKGIGKIVPIKCDITAQDDLVRVLTKLEKDEGRIRVLINNAGISYYRNFADLNLDLWKKMFDLNVFGMFHGIKYVMESIKKSDPGLVHIINVNSIAGQYKMADLNIAPYQSTKFSVTILTRALSEQVAKDKLNVRVTSISPGCVKTEIMEKGGWSERIYEDNPHLDPDDVAQAVVNILSYPANVVISELTIRPKGETF